MYNLTTVFSYFPKKPTECLHFQRGWDLKSPNPRASKIRISALPENVPVDALNSYHFILLFFNLNFVS